MKKPKIKKRFMKFCPKCRSLDVRTNFQMGLIFLGFPPYYSCKKCGYTSKFFPEVDVNSKSKKSKR